MKNPRPIPDFLAHLKTHKGYAVPYFVAYVPSPATGEMLPDFRFTDPKKRDTCLKYGKCFICGNKITGLGHLISGPLGLQNRISTDTPMHEACARYSLDVCPHLYFEKSARRDTNAPPPHALSGDRNHAPDKPTEFFLVRIGGYGMVFSDGVDLLNYQPVAFERFTYENGVLAADGAGFQRPTSLKQWKHPNCRRK